MKVGAVNRRRSRWAALFALASAAALSGCYYNPYTGYFDPYPPPYPYGAPAFYYPYGAPHAYPPAAPPPAGNAPVEQAPLPPPQ
jgi:hypothetical protein